MFRFYCCCCFHSKILCSIFVLFCWIRELTWPDQSINSCPFLKRNYVDNLIQLANLFILLDEFIILFFLHTQIFEVEQVNFVVVVVAVFSLSMILMMINIFFHNFFLCIFLSLTFLFLAFYFLSAITIIVSNDNITIWNKKNKRNYGEESVAAEKKTFFFNLIRIYFIILDMFFVCCCCCCWCTIQTTQ